MVDSIEDTVANIRASGKAIYIDTMPRSLRARRMLWGIVYHLFFKPTPRFIFKAWRRWLLRRFGAKIGQGAHIAPSCFVWAPWNLSMGDYACLGDGVDCYSQSEITLGDYSTVSQRSYLCTASHDIRQFSRPLISSPITIAPHAWVCAEAFIGPGVEIGEGAIVAARAVVVRDVAPWKVMGGNPAREIGQRRIDGISEVGSEQA